MYNKGLIEIKHPMELPYFKSDGCQQQRFWRRLLGKLETSPCINLILVVTEERACAAFSEV